MSSEKVVVKAQPTGSRKESARSNNKGQPQQRQQKSPQEHSSPTPTAKEHSSPTSTAKEHSPPVSTGKEHSSTARVKDVSKNGAATIAASASTVVTSG
jgi:hypothetical protein